MKLTVVNFRGLIFCLLLLNWVNFDWLGFYLKLKLTTFWGYFKRNLDKIELLGQKHVIKVYCIFIVSWKTNMVIITCNAATFLRSCFILWLFMCFNQYPLTLQEWLYVLIMSRTRYRVNLHPIVAWMSKNSLLETDAISKI